MSPEENRVAALQPEEIQALVAVFDALAKFDSEDQRGLAQPN